MTVYQRRGGKSSSQNKEEVTIVLILFCVRTDKRIDRKMRETLYHQTSLLLKRQIPSFPEVLLITPRLSTPRLYGRHTRDYTVRKNASMRTLHSIAAKCETVGVPSKWLDTTPLNTTPCNTTPCSSLFQSSKSLALESLNGAQPDRSMKGCIDEQIIPLLNEINSKTDLYTTSSCAGRVQILGMVKIMKEKEYQIKPYWIYQNHSGITGNVLRELHQRWSGLDSTIGDKHTMAKTTDVLKGIQEDVKLEHPITEGMLNIPENGESRLIEIRLICQGPILHIATPSTEKGNLLMMKLQHAGIKQTMIRSITPRKTILSCTSTTNLSVILWLRESTGWMVDLSKDCLSDALANVMTRTMFDSRKQYFNKVATAIRDDVFNF